MTVDTSNGTKCLEIENNMDKLTMKEFTEQGKVSRQTVYDWMERGFIKRKNFGKKPYFTQSDLGLIPAIRRTLKQNQYRMMKGEKCTQLNNTPSELIEA